MTRIPSLRNLVEADAELAVAVVDKESHPLEQVAEAEVAGLLGQRAGVELDARGTARPKPQHG